MNVDRKNFHLYNTKWQREEGKEKKRLYPPSK